MPNPRLIVIGLGGIAAAITLIVPTIEKWEGTELRPYPDLGGVVTVCTGHTGSDIVVKTYTRPECREILNKDIDKFARGVLKISPELEDRPYQFGSTISFSFNIGLKNYKASSVAREFKVGNFKQGCQNMLKYVYIGKTYSKGLDNRRHDEYNICMKGL